MPDYEHMYFTLFNALTDAIWDIEEGRIIEAVERLKKAQQEGEDIYCDAKD